MMKTPRANFLMLLVLLLIAGLLSAQQIESDSAGRTPASGDIYLAGASVQMLTDVEGDAVVAGAIVNIVKSVSEDVLAAGAMVSVTGDIGDDIRAAAASVSVAGNVAGDVVVAAGSVTLEPSSTVGGSAWLAGNVIRVAGNVTRELSANGGQVIVSGTIGGNVNIHADSIKVEPGAVIKGDLTYSAPEEVVVREGAVIEGAVKRQEFDIADIETWGAEIRGSLLFYLSMTIAAIVLFLIYPRSSVIVVGQLGGSPFKSLGLGVPVLITTPIVAIILLFSVLGVPLGLLALALYLATLVAGLLVGIAWIGDQGFRALGKDPDQSRWTRVLSIAVGAVALMIVDFIPYVGGWVFFIVLLVGIGALGLHAYRLRTG